MNETSKNIQLTLLHPPEENEDEIRIDFRTIFEGMKRFVALWLVFALAIGVISVGVGYLLQSFFDDTKAEAIIKVSDSSMQSSSTLNSTDVLNKFRSPTVVSEALSALNFDTDDVDDVRSNLYMTSIVPDASLDRMMLSYDLLSKGGNLEIVDSLLAISYQADRFLLSFDYQKAGYRKEEGIALLNELIAAYQSYYDANYNSSSMLGGISSVIDFEEYDYAEGASIFSDSLDRILAYLSSVSAENAQFRSNESGYTFQDLYRIARILKDVDLDRINSFIYIHGVSSYDLDTVVSHYEWMIEQAQQQMNVLETQYNSLTDSIAAYEKDFVVYSLWDSGTTYSEDDQGGNLYDDMIAQKLNTRRAISNYQKTVEHYQKMIERYQANYPPHSKDIVTIEQYLKALNEKINQLIDNVNITADEFYERAAFVDTMKILVPATAEASSLIPSFVIRMALITEALLFVIYLVAAVGYGIKKSNNKEDMLSSSSGTKEIHS